MKRGRKTDLVEAVHVELPDERAKVAVFEEAGQELFTEAVGRGDCVTVLARGQSRGERDEMRDEVRTDQRTSLRRRST